MTNIKELSSSIDSFQESTDAMSDTVRSSSASSVDGDAIAAALATPSAAISTGKRGRADASPASPQSWLSWLSDKYTIQYSIPPAYAPAALQVAITVFPLGIVFGLVLPRSLAFFANTLASSSASASVHETPWWTFPQLHLYMLAWVTFHMLEFTVTASYNPTRLFSDSFLLNNGVHYHIAHLFSLLEFCLTSHFYPASKSTSMFTLFGILLILVGQTLRSMAMIHAHNNFSHVLAYKKRTDHELVTTGVYAWTRHPSYVGFSYWAVGTQIMLGNKIAAVGFVGTLWLFFSRRIRAEEKSLVEFFGQKYVDYSKRVGTGLPFI